MPHWKCSSNFQFCAFEKKKAQVPPSAFSLKVPAFVQMTNLHQKPWLPMWQYLQIEGGYQKTSHFALSGITNTSRGSTSKGLLPPHLKGRERPISLSARRAPRCSRAAGVTAGDETGRKERSFTLHSPRGWGAVIANCIHRHMRNAWSADGGASGSELIAKHKDGVNSQRIDAHVFGCQRSTARDLWVERKS